jgi:acetylornithine deacetylase
MPAQPLPAVDVPYLTRLLAEPAAGPPPVPLPGTTPAARGAHGARGRTLLLAVAAGDTASRAAAHAAVKAVADAGFELAGAVSVATGAGGGEDGPRPDGVVVLAPTALQVGLGHAGLARLEVTTAGPDAVLALGPLLARVEALAGELRRRPRHPLLGAPSITAAAVAGGAGGCRLMLERRTHPGETEARILAELRQGYGLEARLADWLPAFETRRDAPLAAALAGARRAALGTEPAYVAADGWTAAARWAERGVDAAIIGLEAGAGGGDGGAGEAGRVCDLARILAETVVRWCGRPALERHRS